MNLPSIDPLRDALVANSSRLTPPRTPWSSIFIHGAALLLWVLLFALAFGHGGLLAWSVGGAYIGYDTALLLFVAWQTGTLLRQAAAVAEAPPAEAPPAAAPARVSVGVIIAAHNEAAVLPVTLEALFAQSDPPDDIVIADDGSSDGTAELMRVRYGIAPADLDAVSAPGAHHPALRWLRVAHGGKARALNAAIVQMTCTVVLTVDADTMLDSRAIRAVRHAFTAEAELAGITGVIAPLCKATAQGRVFEWFQTYEYIRNFLSRYAWMRLDSLLLISGAFAGFRRASVMVVGGFDPACLVEDYELIHRMRRHAQREGLTWRFRVLGNAYARTEAPGDIGAFLRQRRRWFGGFLQTQYWYRAMVGDARLGWLGVAMLPVKAFDTLQPLYGLTAFFLLVFYIVTGRSAIFMPVAALIGAKVALDLGFHLWSVHLYRRWVGIDTQTSFGAAALAALAEPFSFQLLRHLGAALGWVSFVTGQRDWGAQSRFGFGKGDSR